MIWILGVCSKDEDGEYYLSWYFCLSVCLSLSLSFFSFIYLFIFKKRCDMVVFLGHIFSSKFSMHGYQIVCGCQNVCLNSSRYESVCYQELLIILAISRDSSALRIIGGEKLLGSILSR